MEDKLASMQRFFDACDELMASKHLLADAKIREVLRAAALNDALMGLFEAVTRDFDYRAAKRKYLRAPEETRTGRGEAYLPKDEAELLAFVFCLLAEIDGGTVRFSDFLLRYFYEDGSFTASHALFLERMIRPFRDILRRCFPLDRLSAAAFAPVYTQPQGQDVFGVLLNGAAYELERIRQLPLAQEDAVAGECILAAIQTALGRKDVAQVKAILCGYLYFLHVADESSVNDNQLIQLASTL